MSNFFSNKLKHFDILNHEWKKLENEIKKNKKILNKKVCPICRKSNFTILFKKKGLKFVKCKCKSEHIYINPWINESYLLNHFKIQNPGKFGQMRFSNQKKIIKMT